MPDSPVKIATYQQAAEAEPYRVALEQEGIRVLVDGGHVGTTLSYVGSALGGVRLLVAESDAARALEILAEQQRAERNDDGPWFCGECQEEVDAGFGACWSCGRPRDEVEAPLPPTAQPSDEILDREQPNTDLERPPADAANPYVAPLTEAGGADKSGPPADEETEAMVLRAYRSAILGLIILPVILNFYSMYLLLRASDRGRLSPDGNRRFGWAMRSTSWRGWCGAPSSAACRG